MAKLKEIKQWEEKGYRVTDATVSYVLAWRPRDEKHEVAICLANMHLVKVIK